jgi:pimeloyl-ACP methyl ester carboxylesterase
MRMPESQLQQTNSTDQPAPLVLLPGLICDSTIWARPVAELAQFDPVVIDGYGDADSIGAMAEAVLAAAPARMSLAGHSMGARVALELYARAPQRVERLALLDTGIHPVVPGEAGRRQALIDLGRQRGMEALIDAWLPPMVHPDRRSDPEFMAPLRAMCLRAGIDTFEAQVRALLGRPDARANLGRISCPVLVGVGSDDAWSPVDQHRDIAARIAGATLDVYDGAGHMAPFETPLPVAESLRRWLRLPMDGIQDSE